VDSQIPATNARNGDIHKQAGNMVAEMPEQRNRFVNETAFGGLAQEMMGDRSSGMSSGCLLPAFELGRKKVSAYILAIRSRHSLRNSPGLTLGFFFLAWPIKAPTACCLPD
jgi:hypothetical protein